MPRPSIACLPALLLAVCAVPNPSVAGPAETVRAIIAEARASAVPERYAPAEALLADALEARPDDHELLTLRATVRQAMHDFAAAHRDLDRALEIAPRSPQARLSRAFLRATRGDTEGAAADCAALPVAAGKVVRAACVARVLDVRGRPRDALALLRGAAAGTPPALRPWVHELLAAFAARAGELVEAEQHHRALLALAPGHERYAVAHAGFLRRTRRPAAALARLPKAETDAGILERALAKRALGADAGEEIAVLEARFTADLAAGHEGHLRETARFYLDIRGNPARAYGLARRNWALQKEPEDRALLLEAAAAARPAPLPHP